jgi:CubicO group peptidase (beta-lactamase class C family)
MFKVAIAFVFALMLSATAWAGNWNQNDEVTDYGSWGIPYNAQPNYATLKYHLKRYLKDHRKFDRYESLPSKNPTKLAIIPSTSSVIQNEMQKSSLISYLVYDKGNIVVDEITPRFDGLVRNDTILYSMSMGKSLTSYMLGHAMCEGYIESLDETISDWPLVHNTLYQNQTLIDLLNMNVGDYTYVHNSKGLLSSGRWYNSHPLESFMKAELWGSKPSLKKYYYNGLASNVILNYVIYKTNGNFQNLLDKVFQQHVGTQGEVFFLRQFMAAESAGPARYSFRATRYDFLRIAVSMLRDWNSDGCMGKYLKEIYNRRIKKNVKLPNKSQWTARYFRGYAGQFHTDFHSFPNRTIMGMDGFGGQKIWIDFERSRIVYIHTVHHDYDWIKVATRVIKGEEDLTNLLGLTKGKTQKASIRTTKYDRTKAGMDMRFKCLADFASANDITDLPANQEIESLIANLEGNDYYRSQRQIVKAGISKEAMDANKEALVRLVNYEGTNEEYCAKPVIVGGVDTAAKYTDEQICAIAKTNGLWNNQYEDERVWVREAKLRGLDCIDSKAFETAAASFSDTKVCDKATAPHGDARKWLADLKSDEAIFHIWREEAERRGLSCNVIKD